MYSADICGFYIQSTEIFALYKRMRPKHTKIWWSTDIENFCVGKHTYSIKNLDRLQAKVFTLGIQFNILQHNATFKIESETLGIQFNMMQHNRSTFLSIAKD